MVKKDAKPRRRRTDERPIAETGRRHVGGRRHARHRRAAVSARSVERPRRAPFNCGVTRATNASSGKSADARRQDSKLAEPKHAEVKPPQAAAAAGPPRQATRGWGRVEIPQSRNGHYYADVEINGVRVAMLVDTGAYGVLLNARDAKRVGVVPAPGDFIQRTSTANGVTTVAPTQWREVRVGGISLTNVRGAVARAGAASESLLGMSFLGRLSSFRTESGRLILQE